MIQRALFEYWLADPEARAPVELDETTARPYATPVSFVGSSLADTAERFRPGLRMGWAIQHVLDGLQQVELPAASPGEEP